MNSIFERIAQKKILVIGDAMLDCYIEGQLNRISPEAPVLVMEQPQTDSHAGGAANVARNITALGGKAHLIAVKGDDESGKTLHTLLSQDKNLQCDLITDKTRPTTLKTRHVAQGQHLLRSDCESRTALDPKLELALIAKADKAIGSADMVILSDYDKGVLTRSSLLKLIGLARKARVRLVIDPKKQDWSLFEGAELMTPNRSELAMASGMDTQSDAAITKAARKMIKRHQIKAILVTRSEQGMSYIDSKQALHISTRVHSVFDVAGAGDTVIAALALALTAEGTIGAAMRFANLAAAVSVSKKGTASVTPDEMRYYARPKPVMHLDEKIMNLKQLETKLQEWRLAGLQIGFSNGCFDILHQGHVRSLEQAAANCDRLIIGLNDDKSVRGLKGAGRPLNGQTARASVLAALQAVDAVCLFTTPTPLALIKTIKPDLLFKGADYKLKDIVGAEFVTKYGGEVKRLELTSGFSTSALVKKIHNT